MAALITTMRAPPSPPGLCGQVVLVQVDTVTRTCVAGMTLGEESHVQRAVSFLISLQLK